MIAAVANVNADYPGSCGRQGARAGAAAADRVRADTRGLTHALPRRCYEVKCVTGVVVGNYSGSTAVPYNLSQAYVEPGLDLTTLVDGAPLPAARALPCSAALRGRSSAGMPQTTGASTPATLAPRPTSCTPSAGTTRWCAPPGPSRCVPPPTASDVACPAQGLTTPSGSIYVRVTDNCPCVQYDTATGKETGVNTPCCGSVNHFDLSYFAFEKLAHPVRGWLTEDPSSPVPALAAGMGSCALTGTDCRHLAR